MFDDKDVGEFLHSMSLSVLQRVESKIDCQDRRKRAAEVHSLQPIFL